MYSLFVPYSHWMVRIQVLTQATKPSFSCFIHLVLFIATKLLCLLGVCGLKTCSVSKLDSEIIKKHKTSHIFPKLLFCSQNLCLVHTVSTICQQPPQLIFPSASQWPIVFLLSLPCLPMLLHFQISHFTPTSSCTFSPKNLSRQSTLPVKMEGAE